jgi:hypothetical protein
MEFLVAKRIAVAMLSLFDIQETNMSFTTFMIGVPSLYFVGGLVFTIPLLRMDDPTVAEMRYELQHFDFGGKSVAAVIVSLLFIVLWPALHILAIWNAKHLDRKD